jgi:hypothetical protein
MRRHTKQKSLLTITSTVIMAQPKIQQLYGTRTQADIDRFSRLAGHVENAIRSGVYYPNESYMCGNCGYQGMCEKWDYVGRLPVGYAIVKLQDRQVRPFLVRFPQFPVISPVRLRQGERDRCKSVTLQQAAQGLLSALVTCLYEAQI